MRARPLLPQQLATLDGVKPSKELVEVIQRLVDDVGDLDTRIDAIPAPVMPDPIQYRVPFHSAADSNVTLTNQAAAAQFLGNSDRNITKADLTNFSQVRLLARVVTGSASANTPRIYARYLTTYSTTVGDYLAMGATEVECSLTTAGLIDSGWIDLVPGAQADVFLTVIQIGGDAAADPALGHVALDFK